MKTKTGPCRSVFSRTLELNSDLPVKYNIQECLQVFTMHREYNPVMENSEMWFKYYTFVIISGCVRCPSQLSSCENGRPCENVHKLKGPAKDI